jgi:hypothetical protein
MGGGTSSCNYKNTSDQIKITDINGRQTRITIDGVTYTYHDIKSLYNIDGSLYADGKAIIHTNSSAQFHINIDGNPTTVMTVSGDIVVNGSVNGNVRTTSGNINVTKDIEDNVTSVSGNINVSGSVKGNITTTSGDIRIGKRY